MQIENDVLDIVWEVKRIDGRYGIERRRGKFVLCVGGKEEMELPFERLDGRVVEYVRRTRAERAEALMEELDRENAELEREAGRKARRLAERQVEACLSAMTGGKKK